MRAHRDRRRRRARGADRGFEERHGLPVMHAWGMTETVAARHASARSRRAAPARPTTTVTTPRRSRGARRRSSKSARAKRRRPGAVGRRDDGRAGGARAVDRVRATTTGRTTADRFTDDGWFRTGDIVTDRRDGLPRDSRPQQGSDQVGRRVDQLRRARGRAHGPPGGRGSGGGRRCRTRSGSSGRWPPSYCARDTRRRPPSCASISPCDFRAGGSPTTSYSCRAIPRTSTGKFLKSALRDTLRDRLSGA